jgi:dsDNA-specific endonuclease/ATPase MutS2
VFALSPSLNKNEQDAGAKSSDILAVQEECPMTEPVELPIEDSIDLHSFQPREIDDLVKEYLFQARLKGFREVRIIHGRGIGVQRRMIHSLLEKHEGVLRFRDEMDRGSTVVVLKQ